MSECDRLEQTRLLLGQQRTAAYGDALALARKLEEERDRLRELLREARGYVDWHDCKGRDLLLPRIDAALVVDDQPAIDKVATLESQIAGLRAEVAALKKDAERYRWLREQHWFSSTMCVVVNPKDAVKLGYDCPSLVRLDAAIDAAREGK